MPGACRRLILAAPMRRIALIAMIAMAALPELAGSLALNPLSWRLDPSPCSVLSAGGGRPLLLYFTAAWCGPCRILEREVFGHPDAAVELGHYDLVRLNLDNPNGRAVADSHQVHTVPTFVMLASDGRQIERITGYRSRRLLLRDLARFREGTGTVDDLLRRLADRPEDHLLRLELGLRHHDRQEFQSAAEHLSRGLRVVHATPGSNTPDRAVVISARPDTVVAEASRALARILRRQDRSDEAAQVLQRLLHRWPAHPHTRVTWRLLADCLAESGNRLAAAAALGEAATIEPRRADLLDTFARTAVALPWNLEGAEAAARQAVAISDRSDPRYMATLAQVLSRRRRHPEALLWIKRAEAAAPDDPRWQEHRQMILQAAIDGR